MAAGTASKDFLDAVRPSSMAQVLSAAATQKANENNMRVAPPRDELDDDLAEKKKAETKAPRGPSAKDEEFLWKVFQAFDQNASGTISALEVRSLFDRVALEATYAQKGKASAVDKSLKAATRFITQLFDDDLDGKLGRQELDRFFQAFNHDDDKVVSWDEFLFHGARLMDAYRQKEVEEDIRNEHVPTREEMKAEAEKAREKREKELRRAERRRGVVVEPSKKKSGAPSMLTRGKEDKSAAPGGQEPSRGSPPGRTAGLRTAPQRPSFA